MIRSTLNVYREEVDGTLTNKVVSVKVSWVTDAGLTHDWDWSPPVIELLNGYISHNDFDLDDTRHFGIVCSVASKLSNINPLLIAADENAALNVLELLLIGESVIVGQRLEQHEADVEIAQTLKQNGRLN